MKQWLMIVLVIVGLLVGVVSLYMASLSGVMSKMGLVGGDFSQSIDVNELARQLVGQKEEFSCSVWHVAGHVPGYFFAQGEQKAMLAGQLGGERIICGIRLVQNGNVERGVYTIVKGLYYLKNYYVEMRVLIEKDPKKCNLVESKYERWVEGYLLATEGRAQEVVFGVYKQVEAARVGVEELCID
ncbi:MAG: hypothetical protein ABII21_01605 [bacterium]